MNDSVIFIENKKMFYTLDNQKGRKNLENNLKYI